MSHKLTHEEFERRVREVRGDEVIFLSKYVGANKPIKVRYKTCGHEVTLKKPYGLINNKHCRVCRNTSRRLSPEVFEERFKKAHGESYQLLTPYKNARTKVKVKHLTCGNTYEVAPKQAVSNSLCPYCAKNAVWSTDKFIQKLEAKYPKQYQVLGEYTGMGNKVKVKHLECGHIWEPVPNNLLQGHGCPICATKKQAEKRRLKLPDIAKRLYDLYQGSIIMNNPNEYENNHKPVGITCLKCGWKGKVELTNLLQGHGCNNCANKLRGQKNALGVTKVANYIKKMTNGEYVLMSEEYKKGTSPIKIKHLECGTIFTTTWNKFNQGANKCPNCRGSLGEQAIKGYLKQKDLKYEYGYLIPNLKDERKLHFDFFLPDYNIAIEYDGVQHYSKESNLYSDDIVKHDRMKDQYCYQRQLLLIRVPYYVDINTWLDQTLMIAIAIKGNQYQLEMKKVATSELTDLMLNYHYLHRKVGAKFAYGLYVNQLLVGMVTYSPVMKTTIKRIFKQRANINNTLELSRLYIKNEVSQTITHITSKFVAWTLRQLKKEGNYNIISYTDSEMGHVGTIYQATNFLYCGLSSSQGEYAWGGPNRYRQRWVKGNYYRYLIIPSKKHLYATRVGNKHFKRTLKQDLKLYDPTYIHQTATCYPVGKGEDRLIKDRETGKVYHESELIELLNQEE